MGFVNDDSDSGAEADTPKSPADEEAQLADGKQSLFHNPSNSHRVPPPNDACTPTTKNNDLLSITHLRRKGITESEEIWEELEDDAPAEMSPFSHRRSSARSTPISKLPSRENPRTENTNESTALLARSGTGRSYRDRKRRRSTPISETQEMERRRRSTSSHEALGGWWKMRNWWSGKDRKDKGKGKGTGNGNGNGNGDVA